MNKKIIGIFIVMLLIGTVNSTMSTYQKQVIETETPMILNESIEVIDQQNIHDNTHGVGIDSVDESFAQSFIPEHKPLTKIVLSRGSQGAPEKANFTVSIRETIDGEDIVSGTVNSDDFNPIFPDTYFVFPDTDLLIGSTYYMVLTSDHRGTSSDFYFWRGSGDTYENGEQWLFRNGQWYTVEEIYENSQDFGFTTYWRDYAPNDPTIDGANNGAAWEQYEYNFSTTDPEGDNIEYYIEWGDGKEFNWIGPYESGEQVTKSHSWTFEGNYTLRVKARDIYGAESDWGTLEVSMPKIKGNMPFGLIFVFGFDVDVKIVQLEPGEDYVDLEVLSKPFYICENGIQKRNPGEFIRLYNAKGLFSPSLPFCFGICDDWGIIG